jgi:CheY-like chemotaxis protein
VVKCSCSWENQKLPLTKKENTKMEMSAKILLCSENAEERANVHESLSKAGYRFVEEAPNGEIAIDKLEKSTYDIAIVDLWMSGLDGI